MVLTWKKPVRLIDGLVVGAAVVMTIHSVLRADAPIFGAIAVGLASSRIVPRSSAPRILTIAFLQLFLLALVFPRLSYGREIYALDIVLVALGSYMTTATSRR